MCLFLLQFYKICFFALYVISGTRIRGAGKIWAKYLKLFSEGHWRIKSDSRILTPPPQNFNIANAEEISPYN